MMRQEFGDLKQYCVRYDAYETKVDIVGNLTRKELADLIRILQHAKGIRED